MLSIVALLSMRASFGNDQLGGSCLRRFLFVVVVVVVPRPGSPKSAFHICETSFLPLKRVVVDLISVWTNHIVVAVE